MRRPSSLVILALLAGGCLTPAGQKVTVLLTDRTLTCTEDADGKRIAVLELAQEDDLYQVPLVERATGVVRTLAGRRDGLEVTFDCPESLGELRVRLATILQSRADVSADTGSGSSSGGGGRPPPS
ncbi:MAG: hypothetical protein H6732_20210 [Alphaproteobacteria bacterium]|nr:hypothetical protein [Alphaproteobacteria bacterium]